MTANPVALFFALLSLHLTWASTSQAAALECRQLPSLFEAFERKHYIVHELTPEVKTRAVSKFIEALDPTRTLLLESDVKRLEKELAVVFDTMDEGDCGVLTNAFRLVIARSEEDERIAKAFLTPGYKLDESVELVLDPEKRGYAKTPEERTDLARKMLHFQISNYLLSGLDLAAAKKQLLHRYELDTRRLKDRDEKGVVPTMFAEQFAEALDPHSSFMSADTLAEFNIQMRLSLEGIGAALSSEDGVTVIESLVPGGQAEKTQLLRPKDKIIAVAQEGEKAVPTIDMELRDVVKMIRGKKGTKVTLTILRESAATKTFDVTIVRDKIEMKEQAAKIKYETRKVGDKSYKIGIIDLPSFYGGGNEEGGRSSFGDMKRLLQEARTEKVDGILVDLSRNGGGLLEDAVKIAGLFIKRGGVVATRSTSGRVEVLEDEDDDVLFSGPLVVITSPASASAAEILAGTLQDYRRAVIIGGEQTFGKGTVQVLLPLPAELGAMKVTTGMFFLPAGKSTQQKGVTSNIRVPSVLDGVEVGEKSLDYSLPPQSTEPFVSKSANTGEGPKRWRPIAEAEIAELSKRSAERVAKDPHMADIKKQLEEGKKNKGIVRLADLRSKAKEDDAKNGKDAKDKTSRQQTRDKFNEAQAVFEGASILTDLITIRGAGGTRLVGPAQD